MRMMAFSMSGAADLSLAEAASLLHSRELSPVDYVAAFLERIAAHDSHLNAFLQVFSDSALADARAAEAELNEGRWRGPLHGVPIALKDLFDIVGEPTTAHSKILRWHRAERSAHVVTKLREAGAIIIGKTAPRHRGALLRLALASGTEPLAAHPSSRWVVQRVGGCRGGGFRPGFTRHRHRRIGSQSRDLLRGGRYETDLWRGQPDRRLPAGIFA